MAERVDQLIPYGYAETPISTFHAFGDRVLRESRARGRASTRSSACSRSPSRSSSCASASSSCRCGASGRSATRRATWPRSRRWSAAPRTRTSRPQQYRAWAEATARRRAASDEQRDAAEAQLELAALLRGVPGAAGRGRARRLRRPDPPPAGAAARRGRRCWRACAARYRFVLVDEFQDTNHAQLELVKLLAGESGQHHGRRRRRPGDLPLARRRRREPARLPPPLPRRARGGAGRELPLDAGDPGRRGAAHLLQQPVPAGGHRRHRQAAALAARGRPAGAPRPLRHASRPRRTASPR